MVPDQFQTVVEALLAAPPLEDVTRRRIPAGKVQPEDMDTVALMLATVQRVGKPR